MPVGDQSYFAAWVVGLTAQALTKRGIRVDNSMETLPEVIDKLQRELVGLQLELL